MDNERGQRIKIQSYRSGMGGSFLKSMVCGLQQNYSCKARLHCGRIVRELLSNGRACLSRVFITTLCGLQQKYNDAHTEDEIVMKILPVRFATKLQ